jgi:hypothetical protein
MVVWVGARGHIGDVGNGFRIRTEVRRCENNYLMTGN